MKTPHGHRALQDQMVTDLWGRDCALSQKKIKQGFTIGSGEGKQKSWTLSREAQGEGKEKQKQKAEAEAEAGKTSKVGKE